MSRDGPALETLYEYRSHPRREISAYGLIIISLFIVLFLAFALVTADSFTGRLLYFIGMLIFLPGLCELSKQIITDFSAELHMTNTTLSWKTNRGTPPAGAIAMAQVNKMIVHRTPDADYSEIAFFMKNGEVIELPTPTLLDDHETEKLLNVIRQRFLNVTIEESSPESALQTQPSLAPSGSGPRVTW